mmetsp:Transcript_38580/g.61867  ORF Transcript_38580/g.61867 Transcript_38580/m.61867 type:complete len:398 (-) Transcript_38580:178-1371(-)
MLFFLKDYDCGGIFSGSATIVEGSPVLTYSVQCGESIAIAVPKDPNDPDLKEWVKPDSNPVIHRPNTTQNFRDPTEAWRGEEDGLYRMIVNCDEGTCLFKSENFVNWTYTGIMWPTDAGFQECPDFYKLPGTETYVYKGSIQGQEWWLVGEYKEVPGLNALDKFVNTSADVLFNNQRYDMGTFYASKRFFDPVKNRQVLFAWVNYHCNDTDWAGVQSFPRIVLPNPAKDNSIITYPIEELQTLRSPSTPVWTIENTTLNSRGGKTASITSPDNVGAQLDILASFRMTKGLALDFQLFFDTTTGDNKAVSIASTAQPSFPTLMGEAFEMYESDAGVVTLRILVDRSIIEVFVQGGRSAMTEAYCAPNPEHIDDMKVKVVNQGDADVELLSLDVYTLKP